MFDQSGGAATMTKAKKAADEGGQSITIRVSLQAYGFLTELAGMKRMKLGDCASDLIIRYADREAKEHAKAILKRGEPK